MSRTELDVCLVVVSESATLVELSARLGVEPSDGSHSMGEPHLLKSRGTWRSTVWQCCSGRPRTASVEEQFEALARRLSPVGLRDAGALVVRTYISVGLFSDAQTPTVELTRACLDVAATYAATIEVKVYTPDMDV